ncbi:AT-rich interactive domain-containing protein 2 [Caerostris extrusa]|uniref:AT-rich interactive domain-containing protein 2 n=1 Tax=Caerostris extrusa TaxID=172846 RepID=A0AAV4NSH5_CAEEX|nr:AT-rich interactive domain-containing protein 2 [Caerostris extrusa]
MSFREFQQIKSITSRSDLIASQTYLRDASEFEVFHEDSSGETGAIYKNVDNATCGLAHHHVRERERGKTGRDNSPNVEKEFNPLAACVSIRVAVLVWSWRRVGVYFDRTPFRHLPQINGLEIDLLKLYNIVTSLGGLQKVIEHQKWDNVVEGLKLPKSCVNFSLTLRHIYISIDRTGKPDTNKLDNLIACRPFAKSFHNVKNRSISMERQIWQPCKPVPMSSKTFPTETASDTSTT